MIAKKYAIFSHLYFFLVASQQNRLLQRKLITEHKTANPNASFLSNFTILIILIFSLKKFNIQ